jgi:hypothetical protein
MKGQKKHINEHINVDIVGGVRDYLFQCEGVKQCHLLVSSQSSPVDLSDRRSRKTKEINEQRKTVGLSLPC